MSLKITLCFIGDSFLNSCNIGRMIILIVNVFYNFIFDKVLR